MMRLRFCLVIHTLSLYNTIEPCHWLDWNKPSQVVTFASCEVANLETKSAIAWSLQ